MKKLMLCIAVYLISALSVKPVMAVETFPNATIQSIDGYIQKIYKQIDFNGCSKLDYEVFSKAMHGYMNLRSAGKLTGKEIITICDFTKSSADNRMWIIDLHSKKVLYNTYVAHGQGSGDEYATAFSNNNDSHQSSLGFYVTENTYIGEHGTSLRLMGMDKGFNNAAYDRGIVVHGADYVSDRFVASNDRLGRSWGCPAVPSKLSGSIINTIKDGTCLFIYYPQKNYLQASYWLNKKIERLPEDNMFPDFKQPQSTDTVIQYVYNGKIDSTVRLN